MKPARERARDIERVWDDLRERARQPGIERHGEWGSGEAFLVRRLGMRIDVIAYVETLDGELWLQLYVGPSSGDREPSRHELGWALSTFAGEGRRAIITLDANDRERHPCWAALWIPLERWPLPTFP